MRYKSGSILSLGIILGPKEPANVDPYLSIFVDEIQMLNRLRVYIRCLQRRGAECP